MTATAEKIWSELQTLSTSERWELLSRLSEDLNDSWDRQMEEDMKAGRLDALLHEAEEDAKAGRLRPLDDLLNDA